MLFWTHIYDFIAKVAALFIGHYAGFELYSGPPIVELGLTILFAVAWAVWFFVLRPLSSLLYAKIALKTDLSLSQAKKASILFLPVHALKWQPMKGLLELPQASRPEAIMKAVDEEMSGHKEWFGKPLWRRTAEILAGIAIVAAVFYFFA